MATDKDIGVGKRWPTEWHKEQELEDLHRELRGAELRGEEDYAKAVQAQINTFKGGAKK